VHPRPATDEEERKASFVRHVVPEIDVLYRVALTLVDRPADAEDVVQDTLLRAYRALPPFDARHPRAWLLTILRNAHRNRNRNRRRRPDLLRDPESQADAAGPLMPHRARKGSWLTAPSMSQLRRPWRPCPSRCGGFSSSWISTA
jgi:DNA-directed RNA polymerase specialized sigma24 family protein